MLAETPEPQVNLPDTTPQLPLEDVRVKPSPEEAAWYVAQVPEVYHVPPEMRQPFFEPDEITFRYPLPLKAGPVAVGDGAAEVRVEVGEDEEPLGGYLMPVAGQEEDEPSLSAGSKVPLCTLPRTL